MRGRLGLAIVLAGMVAMSGCAVPSAQDQYEAAIAGAAVKRPGAAATLDPILASPVKAVTWSPYWQSFETPPYGSPLYGETWITTDSHLKDRCVGFPRDRLVGRIEQLLGLPPGTGKDRRVVTFEVARDQVFRPCADPSVETRACPSLVPPAPEGGAARSSDVPDAHLRWLAGQMMLSYRVGPAGESGYPFTGLGYTYDWNPDGGTHVGLSEYIVRKGAEITNVRVTTTEAYCAR